MSHEAMNKQTTKQNDRYPINRRKKSMLSKLSISQKILIGFTLPMLLTSFLAIATYNSTNTSIKMADSVRHTQEVIAEGHELEKLIVNMETGERGFLITGKDSFL